MPRIPHVALFIETSRGYARGLLQGVIRYQREHGPWSLYFRPHDLGAPLPRWLKNWHGDGILARINDRAMAGAILRTGLPAVDMRIAILNTGVPRVTINNPPVVRLAFQHLRDCGFRHFGFLGLPRKANIWMDLRGDLFEQMAREVGAACYRFSGSARPELAAWEEEQELIAAWIRGLPKPVGIMACNDDRGQQALDACRRVNVLVPDEVAVIGVDNDEILCNLSSPRLSTVDPNTEQIGYEAAAMLARLMAGKPSGEPIFVDPRGVVPRESTDVLATEDRTLAEAVRFLREHACDGLRLKDCLRQFSLSRRTLELRMRTLLGRSPKEEITRVQLERAQRLLTETDLPAKAVAEKCGFSQAKYFSQVFHAHFGLPPAAYRKSRRRQPA